MDTFENEIPNRDNVELTLKKFIKENKNLIKNNEELEKKINYLELKNKDLELEIGDLEGEVDRLTQDADDYEIIMEESSMKKKTEIRSLLTKDKKLSKKLNEKILDNEKLTRELKMVVTEKDKIVDQICSIIDELNIKDNHISNLKRKNNTLKNDLKEKTDKSILKIRKMFQMYKKKELDSTAKINFLNDQVVNLATKVDAMEKKKITKELVIKGLSEKIKDRNHKIELISKDTKKMKNEIICLKNKIDHYSSTIRKNTELYNGSKDQIHNLSLKNNFLKERLLKFNKLRDNCIDLICQNDKSDLIEEYVKYCNLEDLAHKCLNFDSLETLKRLIVLGLNPSFKKNELIKTAFRQEKIQIIKYLLSLIYTYNINPFEDGFDILYDVFRNNKIKSAGFLISVLKKSKLIFPKNILSDLKDISKDNKELLKILGILE